MKRIFVLLLSGLIAFMPVEAQYKLDSVPGSRMSDRDLGIQYLRTCRSQRITGLVLLGVGAAATYGGINGITKSVFGDASGYELMFVLGSAVMISSIPVFIVSAKFKGRAEILLRNENIPLARMVPIHRQMPAIGIAFAFR